MRPKKVVFACTRNACRSIVAEALARVVLGPTVEASSFGTDPGAVDPRSLRVLEEIGVETRGLRSKRAGEAADGATHLVTLCAEVEASCPTLPGAMHEHWPTPDPAGEGGPDEGLGAFRRVRDALLARLFVLRRRIVEPAIGLLGGTGFEQALHEHERITVETPFGEPSGPVCLGRVGGKRVAFIARHGEGHRLLPHEVNARANLYALKRVGVTHLISVSAVGSLREEIAPGDPVIVRQLVDRTQGRARTFFGSGVAAHASLADPICNRLADDLKRHARALDARVHGRATYVCIEGPQFSTRAESELLRAGGADVVGMTNAPEAHLAREAEICYATLALPTDYDCWRKRDEQVRVVDVIAVLHANVEKARRIVAATIETIDPARDCECRRTLDAALLTSPERIDAAARVRLHAIVGRRLAEHHP